MVDIALLERYDTNIPDTVREVSARIDALDAELMRGAMEQRFAARKRLSEMLQEATACFSFFSHLYKRWDAILENQEAEAYMAVKARTAGGLGEKFVSAAAEREAAASVKDIRYVVSYYEGEVSRCQEYINSTKKLLELVEAEERTA